MQFKIIQIRDLHKGNLSGPSSVYYLKIKNMLLVRLKHHRLLLREKENYIFYHECLEISIVSV